MKKLVIFMQFAVLFSLHANQKQTNQNWSQKALKNAEYSEIFSQAKEIGSQSGSCPRSSSGAAIAVYQYLVNIGTHVSLQVLKDLITSGYMPKSYLNYI